MWLLHPHEENACASVLTDLLAHCCSQSKNGYDFFPVVYNVCMTNEKFIRIVILELSCENVSGKMLG